MNLDKKSVAKIFFQPSCKFRRYLLGCNDHSAALAKTIEIDGFIDDFKSGSTYCGKQVISGDQVQKKSIVINCVLMARSWSAKRRLEQLDVEYPLDYGDLLAAEPELTPLPNFIDDTRKDLAANENKWVELNMLLADSKSKNVLQEILEYRKTGNLKFLDGYTFCPERQYFSSICPLFENEVFVDCGGFDGDTTERFIKNCPEYNKVWFFEPSTNNMNIAKDRLRNERDIIFIDKGVSNSKDRLKFNATAGSASAISEFGGVDIEVTTIDGEINEHVSFIKMDLEGWELNALKGAQSRIKTDHPRLAIAVYHRASDFWKIPKLVLSFRGDYDVYLRHYTEGWVETIMYFVPKNK